MLDTAYLAETAGTGDGRVALVMLTVAVLPVAASGLWALALAATGHRKCRTCWHGAIPGAAYCRGCAEDTTWT